MIHLLLSGLFLEMKNKKKIITSLFSLLLLIGIIILFIPTISAQTTCNIYTSGSTPLGGFGAAWNVLSTGKELLLNSDCQTSSITFKVGNGNNKLYIYKKGYYYTNTWQPFDFKGTPAQGSADWLIGNATYILSNIPSGKLNWIAYICQFDTSANTWKCGCSDSACTQSYWQLQGANLVSPPSSSNPQPTGTNNNAGTCEVGKRYTYNSQYGPTFCKCPAGTKMIILNPLAGSITTIFECVP